MKNSQVLVCVAALFLATACGHHRDVRPGAKGVNSVTVKADDEASGARDALDQAEHYCKEFEKRAAIIEESTKYTGDMDEKTYKNVKKASKVAKTISGSAYGQGTGSRVKPRFGAEEETGPGLGEATGLGGNVLNDMAGQGYTVTMRFKCQ